MRKPTGFMTSSKHVAEELRKRCMGGHRHVHLEGGRASAAQIYPPALCEAILRGVVRQKKTDQGSQIDMPRMASGQLASFIGSITNRDTSILCNHDGAGKPIGAWPKNWIDPVHEEDGGCDLFGSSPQNGINILKAELDALTWRDGIATATDDVSGTVWEHEWVKAARAEEMTYFKKTAIR